VFDVNVTANYRLIRAMDPLLRQSDAGRAVFVTSGVAREATAYWGPYAASKAALEQMVHIYARELEGTSVRVNLFDPGVVRTALRAQAFPGEPKDQLKSPRRC
jgi:NAD(P)-dependent dehydrogenase (short-subunit alcohol dehydrogenase family)